MPAAHTERRGRPSLRSVGPHPRSAFPPELVLFTSGDCRKRNELTIPDLEETLCGLFKQPPRCVRKSPMA